MTAHRQTAEFGQKEIAVGGCFAAVPGTDLRMPSAPPFASGATPISGAATWGSGWPERYFLDCSFLTTAIPAGRSCSHSQGDGEAWFWLMPVSVAASDGLDAKTLRYLAHWLTPVWPRPKRWGMSWRLFSARHRERGLSARPWPLQKSRPCKAPSQHRKKAGFPPRLPRPHSNV